MKEVDRIIFYADVAPDARQRLSIYSIPLDQVRFPDWLAIVEEPLEGAPRYILNWVTETGEVIDFAFRRSVDEVIVGLIDVIPRAAWKPCDVPLGDYDDLFRFELPARSAIT